MREVYVAVKALIVRDGKILLIKRSSKEDVYRNEWDLPGGKLEFGEHPIDGLKREVKEETGLEIEVIKPISVWTFFKNDWKTQVIGITFLAKPISDEIKLSKEHVDSKWVLPEKIDNYQIHEEIKKLIKSLNYYYDLFSLILFSSSAPKLYSRFQTISCLRLPILISFF